MICAFIENDSHYTTRIMVTHKYGILNRMVIKVNLKKRKKNPATFNITTQIIYLKILKVPCELTEKDIHVQCMS